MPQGCAEVDALGAQAPQAKDHVEVDQETHHCYGQHQRALHRLRVAEALKGLVEDDPGDAQEGKAIDESGQHPPAVVAIGHLRGSWPEGLPGGPPGQAQGQKIGEDMARVGKEGEAVGKNAAHDLNQKDEAGQKDELGQPSIYSE
jgi:hypothetical protein